MRRLAFLAAAALPCVALLLLCAVAIHEWWLISSHQIVVTPPPVRGTSSLPEVPASELIPLILGSGALAGMFAFALVRRSKRALIAGYVVLGVLAVLPLLRRAL